MTDPLLFMCSYDVFLCLILCNIFIVQIICCYIYTTGSVYIVIIIITNNN